VTVTAHAVDRVAMREIGRWVDWHRWVTWKLYRAYLAGQLTAAEWVASHNLWARLLRRGLSS
jgi:hypothetical protein